MKIAILGAGNMGGAVAKGLVRGSIFSEKDITVTAKSQKTLNELKELHPDLNVTFSNEEAVKGADIVVLAVKPWILESVILEIKSSLDYNKQMVISVVAGVSFEDLRHMLINDQIIQPVLFRVIPNTAIWIAESMTIIASDNASTQQEELIKSIFDQLGKSVIVEERLLGAGTALCSCGIAYAFKYIQASMNAGIELGFYPDDAKAMIIQTMRGAADLLERRNSTPLEEIYKVTTPGGITIKGINELDARGFNTAIVEALKKSVAK